MIILGFSALRTRKVARGGGDEVARLLDGRLVDPDTTDAGEARLINVVEEMAIASGLTVPNVHLLDREDGLNAFAAGIEPANAVVAFTVGRPSIDGARRRRPGGMVA